MKTIEGSLVIEENRGAGRQFPRSIAPGKHRVLV